jgi:predicted GNAT family acetyltransferase
MSSSEYSVRDNPAANRFEVEADGELATAEYTLTPNAIMFRHTEVPQALEGRGIGRALVVAGLKAARDRGLKVIPVCTFFAGYMRRHPETLDLLHPDFPL